MSIISVGVLCHFCIGKPRVQSVVFWIYEDLWLQFSYYVGALYVDHQHQATSLA